MKNDKRVNPLQVHLWWAVPLTVLLAGCGAQNPGKTAASNEATVQLEPVKQSSMVPALQTLTASIRETRTALLAKQLTTEQMVRAYLQRINPSHRVCFNQAQRYQHPQALGVAFSASTGYASGAQARAFRARIKPGAAPADYSDIHAREALEIAIAQDRAFQQSGKLTGPLHGLVITLDELRATWGRPTSSSDEADIVRRLRDSGAIVVADLTQQEYAYVGARSPFSGAYCDPYNADLSPNASSAGTGSS